MQVVQPRVSTACRLLASTFFLASRLAVSVRAMVTSSSSPLGVHERLALAILKELNKGAHVDDYNDDNAEVEVALVGGRDGEGDEAEDGTGPHEDGEEVGHVLQVLDRPVNALLLRQFVFPLLQDSLGCCCLRHAQFEIGSVPLGKLFQRDAMVIDFLEFLGFFN
ncbi:unnamed protein product [Sphagnum balticum]